MQKRVGYLRHAWERNCINLKIITHEDYEYHMFSGKHESFETDLQVCVVGTTIWLCLSDLPASITPDLLLASLCTPEILKKQRGRQSFNCYNILK